MANGMSGWVVWVEGEPRGGLKRVYGPPRQLTHLIRGESRLKVVQRPLLVCSSDRAHRLERWPAVLGARLARDDRHDVLGRIHHDLTSDSARATARQVNGGARARQTNGATGGGDVVQGKRVSTGRSRWRYSHRSMYLMTSTARELLTDSKFSNDS
eukprot:scaffold205032_cov33-Tisochrysis_lutea.AAC.3